MLKDTLHIVLDAAFHSSSSIAQLLQSNGSTADHCRQQHSTLAVITIPQLACNTPCAMCCADPTQCFTHAAGIEPELLLLDGTTVPVSSVSDRLLSSFNKQQVEHMLQGLAWTVCKQLNRLKLQARQVRGSVMWQQQMLFTAGVRDVTCVRLGTVSRLAASQAVHPPGQASGLASCAHCSTL